ncbi:MAG: outer membrane protein assembly factor BamD [Candidatus Cloacimonas sp.]
MRKYFLLIPIVVFCLFSCSSNKTQLSTEAKLKNADELYAKGKYSRAATIYEEISFERKSASTAYATMKVADCYFKMNKFADARARYEQFISSFPDHENVSDAYFRKGECLFEESLPPQYDQTETVNCIEAFRTFIDRYPSDSRYGKALEYIQKCQYKLLEKDYLTGYLYYKMKDYSSALMYFDDITALGNYNEIDRQALYYSAKLHLHQKNLEKAKESYTKLQTRYPDSKEAKRLAKKFSALEK